MSDQLIMKALHESIVSAFFEQKQYWDQSSNNYKVYGGLAAGLVAKILELPEFSEMIKNCATEIASKNELISKSVVERLQQKVQDAVETTLTRGNNYYFNQWIDESLKKYIIDNFENIIKTDPAFLESVNKKVAGAIENKNIIIHVSVTVTEKPKE